MFQSLIGILVDIDLSPDEFLQSPKLQIKFQSLIGILVDIDLGAAAALGTLAAFQSLIGILVDIDSGYLKPFVYLLFKVHLRLPLKF